MAAPKNNTNAVGNKGGRNKNVNLQKKVDTFKGLVLDDIIEVMQGKNKTKKWELTMRCVNNILPRSVEVGDPDGNPIQMGFVALPPLKKDE